MKIAITFGFFLPVPPARGGATEKIWFNLGRRLAARGHSVSLFARTWEDWPTIEQVDGMEIRRVPGWDHRARLWQNLLLDFRWGLRLRRLLPRDAAVIAHNVFLPILLRLPPRHRPPVCVVLGRMPKGQVRFYGSTDRIFATSQAVAAQARRENPRAAARIKVLRNCIDWPAFQDSPKRDPSTPLRIGYAGRIHPEKGLDILVRAAGLLAEDPKLPPWEVALIGPVRTTDGGGGEQFLDSLRRLAREHGAGGRVQFLPPAYNPTDLVRFYCSLDIFCYPTRAEKGEGLSVAPIEAMAAGAVPVLSRLDCFADLVRTNENGLLFDHRAADADCRLAAELAALLRDADRRKRLGAAARATARDFDYGTVAAELDLDLCSLLAGTAPHLTHEHST
jgi:glycosyltransferase involved in cell wall biosynthesis